MLNESVSLARGFYPPTGGSSWWTCCCCFSANGDDEKQKNSIRYKKKVPAFQIQYYGREVLIN